MTKIFSIIPFLLYICLQLIFAVHVQPVEYDEAIYMNVARSIRQTGLAMRPIGHSGSLLADHTTLYQHLLAIFTMIIGEKLLPLRLITSAVGIAILIHLYRWITQIRNQTSAFVATTFLAVNSFWAVYAFHIREEIWMAGSILTSLYFVWKFEQTSQVKHIWRAGIWSGIAVLFKEMALIYCVPLFIFCLLWRKQPYLKTLPAVAVPPFIALSGFLLYVYAISPSRARLTIERWTTSTGGNGTGERFGITWQEWASRLGSDFFSWGLLMMVAVSIFLFLWQRNNFPRTLYLAWGYLLFAIFLSFQISLKEPRHLIGILPITTLLIGGMVDWERILQSRFKLPIWIGLMGLLLIASPAKLNRTTQIANFESWWKPFPHYRLFEEKRNFGILAEVGRRVSQLTEPDDIIAVVHEAPVVSYYADRNYTMLYSIDQEGLDISLGKSAVFIEDRWMFLKLNETEQNNLRNKLNQLKTEAIIEGEYRNIPIYRLEHNQ